MIIVYHFHMYSRNSYNMKYISTPMYYVYFRKYEVSKFFFLNKGNNKIIEHRAIFQRESQNS